MNYTDRAIIELLSIVRISIYDVELDRIRGMYTVYQRNVYAKRISEIYEITNNMVRLVQEGENRELHNAFKKLS